MDHQGKNLFQLVEEKKMDQKKKEKPCSLQLLLKREEETRHHNWLEQLLKKRNECIRAIETEYEKCLASVENRRKKSGYLLLPLQPYSSAFSFFSLREISFHLEETIVSVCNMSKGMFQVAFRPYCLVGGKDTTSLSKYILPLSRDMKETLQELSKYVHFEAQVLCQSGGQKDMHRKEETRQKGEEDEEEEDEESDDEGEEEDIKMERTRREEVEKEETEETETETETKEGIEKKREKEVETETETEIGAEVETEIETETEKKEGKKRQEVRKGTTEMIEKRIFLNLHIPFFEKQDKEAKVSLFLKCNTYPVQPFPFRLSCVSFTSSITGLQGPSFQLWLPVSSSFSKTKLEVLKKIDQYAKPLDGDVFDVILLNNKKWSPLLEADTIHFEKCQHFRYHLFVKEKKDS